MDSFVAVASYLPRFAAHLLAGRLKAEGIDARVTSQGDPLEPYRGPGAHSFARVIAPERDAARARWIVDGLHQTAQPQGPWHPGTEGP